MVVVAMRPPLIVALLNLPSFCSIENASWKFHEISGGIRIAVCLVSANIWQEGGFY